ncbi:MAG TPA: SelB C-terminal domain-containing protein, partial [Micromonosporaceae bacterium]|nr:SelB C-terminal domain-containing protein [Micromonosporaceae bacterium]
RLRLARPLPVRIGDRALLRDAGRHRVAGGVTMLDVQPPPLRRRGAAAARGTVLSSMDGRGDEAAELRRRGLIRRADLIRMGVAVTARPVAGDWLADADEWADLRRRLATEVVRHAEAHPLEPGVPIDALRHALGLPDRALVAALVAPPLVLRAGRVHPSATAGLPEHVSTAVERLRGELANHPYLAPSGDRLAQLSLGPRELAAAERAGALLRIADGVVILPRGVDDAAHVLAGLPQPFTLGEARRALGTTRRVAVPLLELLDRRGATRRLPDDRRTVHR